MNEHLLLDAIETRAITAPPWRAQYYACGNDEERESLVERFREHLQSGGDVFYAVGAEAMPQHKFYAEQGYDLARGVTIAFTGNGPNSAENALFIAAAPANILALVAEVRRLRADLEHAKEGLAAYEALRISAEEILDA